MGRERFDYYQARVPVSRDRDAHVFAAIHYHELGAEAAQHRLCKCAVRVHRAAAGRPAPRATRRFLAGVLGWVHSLVR